MAEQEPIGAHGGGIPPGWDFPEAREAAEMGLDLWVLDSNLTQTPDQRLRCAAEWAQMVIRIKRMREFENGSR